MSLLTIKGFPLTHTQTQTLSSQRVVQCQNKHTTLSLSLSAQACHTPPACCVCALCMRVSPPIAFIPQRAPRPLRQHVNLINWKCVRVRVHSHGWARERVQTCLYAHVSTCANALSTCDGSSALARAGASVLQRARMKETMAKRCKRKRRRKQDGFYLLLYDKITHQRSSYLS